MSRASEFEEINVAALGIKDEDRERIERFFALDSNNRFNLVGTEKLSKAHLIVVDADHSMIERKMTVINKQYRFSGILGLSDNNKLLSGTRMISRPLNYRHINAAILGLLQHQPDSNNRENCRVLNLDAQLYGHLELKKHTLELYDNVEIVNVFDMHEAQTMLDMHHFDIVFINENITDIDYFDACKWVKQNHDTTVVLTQHKTGPITRMKAKLAHADDVLNWPIRMYQFQSCFEREMLKFQSQKETHFVVENVSNQ
ncbi:hypothetical protein [Marinicellulosiphila megalodicopiae]|uniref:hypothetical protein n=1 Tax=Marinicellulosiphila megalodicopiae TaxID=2724896 RepID=UPI003BB01139